MRRSNTQPLRRLLRYERNLSRRGYVNIAGVDEAGRGPLAGPVVAGAVILRQFRFKSVIDDSKKLSAKKRESAYKEIMDTSIVGIGIVDEKTIDSINIYQATRKAMEAAVADLAMSPDYIIVDGNINFPAGCSVQSIISGDSKCLSIAAASIIAKVTRDRIMLDYHKRYPEYGFAQHKGYPTRNHKIALKKHGPSSIHRLTFQPVAELI